MADDPLISLGDHFVQFIDKQVEAGRYGSASEVVHAGLQLLEERETKLSTLQSALIEGEESGESLEFDVERFLDSVHQPAGE